MSGSGEHPGVVDAEGPATPPLDRWKARLGSLGRIRNIPPKYRPWVMVCALAIFLAVSIVSFHSLPRKAQFHWWPLPVLLLVTSPLTLAVNAAEYRVMGLINGHRIRWLPALRLVTFASVANLLPLPGGTVIRSEALHRLGSKYRHAIAANAAAGMVWLAVACVTIGALFVAVPRDRAASPVLIAVGAIVLGVVIAMLRRVSPEHALKRWFQLVIVELATVAVTGARIFLAFRLLGLSASVAQSVALSGSQVIAAAIGIFPSGLGLREALAGAIGSAVHLGVSETVAATASDRVTSQLGLAVIGAPLVFLQRRHPTTAPSLPTDDEPSTRPGPSPS